MVGEGTFSSSEVASKDQELVSILQRVQEAPINGCFFAHLVRCVYCYPLLWHLQVQYFYLPDISGPS